MLVRIRLMLSVALFLAPAFCLGQTATPQSIKAQLLQIAGQHCSQAKYILEAADAADLARWMEGKKASPLDLTNFETAVHEELHGLDDRIGVGDWSDGHSPNGYFIEKGIQIVVPFQKTFHTADLHPDFFPAEVKRLFRYDTYIFDIEDAKGPAPKSTVTAMRPLKAGEAETTSNVQGIYGLLEEHNAYYHGALAEYEIILSGMDVEYFGDNHLVTASYYEFNIFMAYFLKYAKERKPEVHQKLMANKPLRTAYTLVETNWRDLLTKIYQNKQIAAKYPGSEGEFELFTDELREIMNGFMIPQSQLPQYAAFFKSKSYKPELIASNRKGNVMEAFREDFEDLDFDDINLNGREIGAKEKGYFYVVVESYPSVVKAMESFMNVIGKYPKAHVYTDGGKYHLYLDRFTTKAQADAMAQRQKGTYPGVKVL